jgi:hypothetical protein
MAGYREISPKPFHGFTATLAAATVVELDPQPFSNTKEVILLNRSTTDAMLVSIERLVAIPSRALFRVPGGADEPLPLIAGMAYSNAVVGASDTLTVGGVTYTATNAVQIQGAATDTFSVPVQATVTLTINVGGAGTLTAGDTITFTFPDVIGPAGTAPAGPPIIWTAAAVPGANQWDSTVAGDALIATTIATAIAGAANTTFPEWIQAAVATGNTVTFTLSSNRGPTVSEAGQANRGLSGNGATITAVTAVAGAITPTAATNFAGGLDARLAKLAGAAAFVQNDASANIAWAINDTSNGNGGDIQALNDLTSTDIDIFVYTPVGVAGNGLVISSTAPITRINPQVAVSLNGANALPAALAAATSTVIPAGGAITLSVGSEGNRQPLGGANFWNVDAGYLPGSLSTGFSAIHSYAGQGSGLGIVVQMETGGPGALNVTYVQNRGYWEGV